MTTCVDMNTMEVHQRGQSFENDPIPVIPTRQATAYELNARIGPLHHLGELAGLFHILFGVEGSNLPATVHLVAQPPILDVVWFLVTVLATQIGPRGVALSIAVFYPRLGFVHGPIAHVDADVGFDAEELAILNKLVGSKAVGF